MEFPYLDKKENPRYLPRREFTLLKHFISNNHPKKLSAIDFCDFLQIKFKAHYVENKIRVIFFFFSSPLKMIES